MKKIKLIAVAAGMLAVSPIISWARAQDMTGTNMVTVVVTNVVTITNLVTAVPAAAAESNPADVEPMVKYPWQSSISAGLTLTRGNSHTLLYSGSFQTDKKTPNNEYSLGADGAYGSQNSQDNVNNYGGFAQWNHLFTERLYGYIRVDALRDVINDLDYRLNIGPGAGYYLIKEADTSLSAEAGGGMQIQHLGGNYDSFGTVRFAENYEHKFSGRARLWQKAEFLAQLDKFQNFTVNAEIGVEASITGSLSLKTCLDDSYLSEPAAGRKRNDIKLISGVSYKF